jgi:hypothetical protein
MLALTFLTRSFLFFATLSFANAASFTPTSGASSLTDIIGEMDEHSFEKINLQNKPLIFADAKVIFNPDMARDFVNHVVTYSGGVIKVLDLSLNRLPEHALPSFLPLLNLGQFEFLDVTTNSGADSLDGMKVLNSEMEKEGVADRARIFEKIIWIPESWVEGAPIPERYKIKHREYYSRMGSFSGFKLPD